MKFKQRIMLYEDRFEWMCRKNGWHIKATEEEYKAMIQMDREHGITPERIYGIALNIAKNNDMSEWLAASGYPLESPNFMELIMSEITIFCCSPLLTIEEE